MGNPVTKLPVIQNKLSSRLNCPTSFAGMLKQIFVCKDHLLQINILLYVRKVFTKKLLFSLAIFFRQNFLLNNE